MLWKCRLKCEVIVLLPVLCPPLLLAVNIRCLILLMLMLSVPNGSKSIISGEMLLHWVAPNVLGMRMAARAFVLLFSKCIIGLACEPSASGSCIMEKNTSLQMIHLLWSMSQSFLLCVSNNLLVVSFLYLSLKHEKFISYLSVFSDWVAFKKF